MLPKPTHSSSQSKSHLYCFVVSNKSRTLALESRYNYTNIALSPDGSLLIAVNEQGDAYLISMVSCTVIHRHKFQTGVQCINFSPDGAYFAVARENLVLIFCAPGEITGEYNPFVLKRSFLGGYDDVTWLDWSSDSKLLAIGSRDSSTKICAVNYMQNFRTYNLSGHTDAIVSCFFESNSLHLNTLSRNGQLCLWECSMDPSDLIEADKPEAAPPARKRRAPNAFKGSDSESEDDIENNVEKQTVKQDLEADQNEVKDGNVGKTHPFFYKKLGRHYLANEPRKEKRDAMLTAANYNRRTKVLVVAFSTGAFYLYELPDVNMIHSLSISEYPISAAVFNCTGDWVALASREIGQLLVWEWQSEQYIMKQQGHSSEMACIAYSPDGQYIATGGEDSKVKLWNTQSSFCFVTFSEHTSGVTAVQFSRNKKFLVSSSLDGTVRAFDIIRYDLSSLNAHKFYHCFLLYAGIVTLEHLHHRLPHSSHAWQWTTLESWSLQEDKMCSRYICGPLRRENCWKLSVVMRGLWPPLLFRQSQLLRRSFLALGTKRSRFGIAWRATASMRQSMRFPT